MKDGNLSCEDPLKTKSVFTSIRLFGFNYVGSDDISEIIISLDLTNNTSDVIQTEIVSKVSFNQKFFFSF